MAQNLLSGKTGSVTVGGNTMSFGKWSIPISCKAVPAHNFVSAPYEMYVSGLLGAKISLEMPAYDAGNTPLTAGTSYSFILAWTATLNLTVTAFITELTPDNNVEGAPTVKVGAQVYGTFTASIT